jgi:hypothetical protein
MGTAQFLRQTGQHRRIPGLGKVGVVRKSRTILTASGVRRSGDRQSRGDAPLDTGIAGGTSWTRERGRFESFSPQCSVDDRGPHVLRGEAVFARSRTYL